MARLSVPSMYTIYIVGLVVFRTLFVASKFPVIYSFDTNGTRILD